MGLLTDLLVKFSVSGESDVAGAMSKVKEGLAGVQVSVSKLDMVFQAVIGRIVAQIEGFARAGLSASAVGQALDFQMERLSRTIAGLFGPEIRKAIDLVAQLNHWIEGLSEKQKANVAHWVEGGAVALAFAAVLPQVVAGATAAAAAIETLTVVLATGEATLGDWAGLVAVLAGGMTALGAGAIVGQGGLGALWETLKPLLATLQEAGGKIMAAFAPLLDTFQRVFQAFLPLVDAVGDMAGAVAELLAPIFEALGEAAILVMNVVEGIVRLATVVVQVVTAILKPIIDLVTWLLSKLNDLMAWLEGRALNAKPKAAEEHGGRGALAPRAGGPESVEAIWTRLAQASVMGTAGKSDAQKQLDKMQEQIDAQHETTDAVKGVKPSVVY